MLSSLIIVSFIFMFAWVQQQFLNRLIDADLKTFEQASSEPSPPGSEANLN
ncbi:MAG: hypothetical protein ACFBSG_03655 [Leptolyngbyaceae cyanobacterium]